MIIRCRNCDSEVLDGWSFCPECGSKVVRRQSISGMFSMGLEDVFNHLMISGISEAFRNFENIRAVDGMAHRIEEKNESKTAVETVEPKIEIMRLPGRIVIEAGLPGIISLSDVDVIELDESIEIRANAGNRKYLKIIQIPPEAHIKEQALSDGGILRLEVGK